MQKDFKIGLALGLALVVAAALWLATRPSLSPKARIQQLHNAGPRQEPAEQPIVPVIARIPAPDFDAERGGNLDTSSAKIPIDAVETAGENEQDSPLDSTIREQAEKIRPQKFHIVRKGETLSGISYKYYGSARRWPRILDANRKRIRDPNKLIPGTKLIIAD